MELREWVVLGICAVGIVILTWIMPDRNDDDDYMTGAGGNA